MSPQKLLYAQVREDQAIDQEALGITSHDRVLAITSGGCTALTLLAQGPKELVACDANPTQNYLLELKILALQNLELEDCKKFLGARKAKNRWDIYQTLSQHLSPEAKSYWDGHSPLIRKGLLYAGVTERMCAWMPSLVLGLVHKPETLRKLFRLKTQTEQEDFYKDIWCNKRWKTALRLAFHPWTFRWMYGRSFMQRFENGNLTKAWVQKLDRAFTELPLKSNYFLSQLLWNRYLPGEQGIPPYLRPEIFERVKSYSDRLRLVTDDIIRFLRSSPAGSFSKITLSNAFEWLPQNRVRPAFQALAHALAPGGRAILRHLLAVTELPAGLGLQELPDLSQKLTQKERAFLYTRVSIYEKIRGHS